jgi:uncharacterized protein (DUF488 family)
MGDDLADESRRNRYETFTPSLLITNLSSRVLTGVTRMAGSRPSLVKRERLKNVMHNLDLDSSVRAVKAE